MSSEFSFCASSTDAIDSILEAHGDMIRGIKEGLEVMLKSRETTHADIIVYLDVWQEFWQRQQEEGKRKISKADKTPIEELSTDLALLFLAEWIAMEHGETKLQADKYAERAQELADLLQTIGYHLLDAKALIEKGGEMERERILKVMDGYCVREIDHAKTMKARLETDNAQSSYIHGEETIIATLERVRQALKGGK